MNDLYVYVIDTIHLDSKRYPGFLAGDEGVRVILDPTQIEDMPDITGNKVKVIRPDNTTLELLVGEIDIRHKVVSLIFQGVLPEEIPRLSIISW